MIAEPGDPNRPSRAVDVLFLPHPDPNLPDVYGDILIEVVAPRHRLRVFQAEEALAPQFAGIDVVIDLGGAAGTREMANVAGHVRLWQILGMGVDHFDLEYWRERGIPVSHCPGPLSAVPLAESALMFILMLARRYPEARQNVADGILYTPITSELGGKALGIIGFGASGRELALRARPFGMEIYAIDIALPEEADAARYGLSFIGYPADLDRILPHLDFVSLHLPLNDDTHHMLDRRRLALLKDSAHVINVARGALVDETALVDALVSGRLAGAGLDVFVEEPLPAESPLMNMPNVVMTPHIAGGTDGSGRRRAELAATNCDRIAQGLEPLHRVV